MSGGSRFCSQSACGAASDFEHFGGGGCINCAEPANGKGASASSPALTAQVLLTERMWRSLGIVQSRGWAHFEAHEPEANVRGEGREEFLHDIQ